MIAKRSKNVAGGCSEAETPGTVLSRTQPDGMPETVGPLLFLGSDPIGPQNMFDRIDPGLQPWLDELLAAWAEFVTSGLTAL